MPITIVDSFASTAPPKVIALKILQTTVVDKDLTGKGHKVGHLAFDPNDFKNCKRAKQQMLLRCKACQALEIAKAKEETMKAKAIKQKLAEKGAWRCTCRGATKYSLANHNSLNERCPLHPVRHGEFRWPGANLKGNKRVTLEEWQFLENFQKRAKH